MIKQAIALVVVALTASTPVHAGLQRFLEKQTFHVITDKEIEDRRKFYQQIGKDAKIKQDEALAKGAMSPADQAEVKLDDLYYRTKYPHTYETLSPEMQAKQNIEDRVFECWRVKNGNDKPDSYLNPPTSQEEDRRIMSDCRAKIR